MNLTIFDQAERKKVQGMELAWFNADTLWKRRAAEILKDLLSTETYLTSEDIIERLETEGITTGNNRAIGSLMTAAHKIGLIQSTGQYRESKLVRRHHAPIRIWEVA